MLFDGKRPPRASSPPFLRLRVRPGQVVAVDQPVGQCDQTSVGTHVNLGWHPEHALVLR